MKFVNIGYGNLVSGSKIVAIVSPESAPIKRLIQDARDKMYAIDATCGRKTRSVLVMDSDKIILSATNVETIAIRTIKANEYNEGEELNANEIEDKEENN